MILALSGVEAIANITGVMKLDPDSTPDAPKVTRTATKAIVPVAIEVVCGTALLGLGDAFAAEILAPELVAHKEDMLRFLGGALRGDWSEARALARPLASFVGIVFGLLLLSAVNTAIVALIGVVYMMAQDGEMPRQFARLNPHGVPRHSADCRGCDSDRGAGGHEGFRESCRSVCHRRGRRDRGQSRLVHI